MPDRPHPPHDLFDDLDEFAGYDDVTGPHHLAMGNDHGDFGSPEDPDFWTDDSPTAAGRLTGAVQAIRASRPAPSGHGNRASARRPPNHRSARRRPDGVDRLSSLPGLGTPFARRVAVIAAVVLLAAPVVSAMRPDGGTAEAEPAAELGSLNIGSAPATAAAVLLNPGAGSQPPTATIDMDALPLLTPGGDAAPAPVAAQATCSGRYTVVSGDSWSLIADKVSVSLSALLDVNDATTRTVLLVGEEICLPKGASAPTTNAPPTTKAPSTTIATPTGPTYTAAQIEAIIREIWPDDLEDTALYIARRESNLNPYARNWCCYGLFQIYWEVHDVWLIPRGVTSASQLFDPRTNTTVALWVYQRSGSFSPWGM